MLLFLKIAMVAAFLGAMLIIKFCVAPAIVAQFGAAGVVVWIGICLAVGRRLED